MCTPPRRNPKPHKRDHVWSPPECHQLDVASATAHCRWIDAVGNEWLFTREGGTLIVERPNARGSVVIRFPDLAQETLDGPASEAWVLFETPDGHLLHSSVCREVGAIEFPESAGPESENTPSNDHPSTWFESGVVGD